MKVRICLNLKRIPFRRVPLTLRRLRELKRISPARQVPVLIDRDQVVGDSSRIVRFLDERYPRPLLVPREPTARAYCQLIEQWADEVLYFIVGAFKWLAKENQRAAWERTFGEFAGAWLRPVAGRLARRRFRRRYRLWGCTGATLPALEERMCSNLELLDPLLEGKPFLLGRPLTVADVAVFAQLRWLRWYAQGRLIDRFGAVRAWLERLEAEPAFAAATS